MNALYYELSHSAVFTKDLEPTHLWPQHTHIASKSSRIREGGGKAVITVDAVLAQLILNAGLMSTRHIRCHLLPVNHCRVGEYLQNPTR